MEKKASRSVRCGLLMFGVFLMIGGAQTATAAVHIFAGSMDVAQASATAMPGAMGSGKIGIVLDDVADTLVISVWFDGLANGNASETVSHIHGPSAGPGMNAPALYTLALGTLKTGTINLAAIGPYTVAAQKADLIAGLWYINIHSTHSGAGEIRGQILAANGMFEGNMDAAQAMATANPGAMGTGTICLKLAKVLDPDILFGRVVFAGLANGDASETVSHIHGPSAGPGTNAAVIYTLPLGTDKNVSIPLMQVGAYTVPQQIADLLAELWYINIHSSHSGAGEIRGQILNGGDGECPALDGFAMVVFGLVVLGGGAVICRKRLMGAAR